MTRYKIEHDREGCIGCGSCAAICGDNWEMADDKKSKPKKVELETENEYNCNKEAADSCPVNVIHLINIETGEKEI